MPRRRIVIPETTNGNGWHPSPTSDNVETPPDSPSRQNSVSSKSSSLRRSLSKTFSSIFRSPSTTSAPSSPPPVKQPVSPNQSTPPLANGQHPRPLPQQQQQPRENSPQLLRQQPPQQQGFSPQQLRQQPQQLYQQDRKNSPQHLQGYSPQESRRDSPQQMQRFSSMDQKKDSLDIPPPSEGSSTLPRHYQKRQQQQQQQQQPAAPARRRQQPKKDDASRSASCTRISDIPDEEIKDRPARSVCNVAEPSPEVNPRRRWHSVLNTANSRASTLDRNGSRLETSRLRFSSTFIRKSVGDDLSAPMSPGPDDAFLSKDEVDSTLDPCSHGIIRHKSKARGVRRLPSKVERKDGYNREGRPVSSSFSASTGTLTRLARKAPTATITDL